jgi:sec-independent protein translocase protein TatA
VGQEMLKNVQGWQLIIVAVVFVLLFGAKKLPDSAKSIAKSLKIFKSELKDDSVKEEKNEEPKSDS